MTLETAPKNTQEATQKTDSSLQGSERRGRSPIQRLADFNSDHPLVSKALIPVAVVLAPVLAPLIGVAEVVHSISHPSVSRRSVRTSPRE